MKKIKLKIYISSLLVLALLVTGCSADLIAPLSNNTTPPGVVTNINVKPGPGIIQLTYTLPSDPDLLYVKAIYTLASGVVKEVRASYYTNTMKLEGFGDEDEHEVLVYAVNRSEVSSAPVSLQVRAEEAALWQVFNSLRAERDFAGYLLTAENPSKASLVIGQLVKDSLGEWNTLESVYTEAAKIRRNMRGFDTIPQEFGFFMRDRFLNYTDTVTFTLTPIYEELLAKNLFNEIILPNDAKLAIPNDGRYDMNQIWNGDRNTRNSERFMTKAGDDEPCWFTFDMGQLAKLNRLVCFNYAEFLSASNQYMFYYRGQLRFFEIWARADYPPADGSWDGWEKLGSYENIKLAGSPYGKQTEEERLAGEAGFNYTFPSSDKKYRYMRIKSNVNWEDSSWIDIVELDIYGTTL